MKYHLSLFLTMYNYLLFHKRNKRKQQMTTLGANLKKLPAVVLNFDQQYIYIYMCLFLCAGVVLCCGRACIIYIYDIMFFFRMFSIYSGSFVNFRYLTSADFTCQLDIAFPYHRSITFTNHSLFQMVVTCNIFAIVIILEYLVLSRVLIRIFRINIKANTQKHQKVVTMKLTANSQQIAIMPPTNLNVVNSISYGLTHVSTKT